MLRAIKISVHVGKDRIVRIPSEIPEGPAEVIVIPVEEVQAYTKATPHRGMGMDTGRFIVPDDFNSPLPWEIQKYFEGEEERKP
jgi:hypothetical protein